MRMHGRLEENTALVLNHIAQAAAAGAGLVVFPELALTGFHRQVPSEADPAAVAQALEKVRAACAALRLACAVGAPRFVDGRRALRPFNSHWLIDEAGQVAAVVHKAGLTPSEAGYFAPGDGRPRAVLQGWRCTSVLCREVEDASAAAQCRSGEGDALDLVFWPSIVTQSPPLPEDDYLPAARALARSSGATVLQCNWPNAVNQPDNRDLGGSRVIGPEGEVLWSLPADQAGLGVWAPGGRGGVWLPGAGQAAGASWVRMAPSDT